MANRRGPYLLDGVEYQTLRQAADALGITPQAVWARLSITPEERRAMKRRVYANNPEAAKKAIAKHKATRREKRFNLTTDVADFIERIASERNITLLAAITAICREHPEWNDDAPR